MSIISSNDYLNYLKTHYKNLDYYNQFLLVPIGNNDTILDYGCGLGGLLTKIHSEHPNTQLIGVDISSQITQQAKKNCSFAKIQKIVHGRPTTLHSGSIDTIFCLDVIEHSENPTLILNELRRLLKPNGKIILCTPDIFSFWPKGKSRNPITNIIFNIYRQFGIEYIDPTHLKEFSVYDMYRLLKRSGFVKMHSNTCDMLHLIPFLNLVTHQPASFIWVISRSKFF